MILNLSMRDDTDPFPERLFELLRRVNYAACQLGADPKLSEIASLTQHGGTVTVTWRGEPPAPVIESLFVLAWKSIDGSAEVDHEEIA